MPFLVYYLKTLETSLQQIFYIQYHLYICFTICESHRPDVPLCASRHKPKQRPNACLAHLRNLPEQALKTLRSHDHQKIIPNSCTDCINTHPAPVQQPDDPPSEIYQTHRHTILNFNNLPTTINTTPHATDDRTLSSLQSL